MIYIIQGLPRHINGQWRWKFDLRSDLWHAQFNTRCQAYEVHSRCCGRSHCHHGPGTLLYGFQRCEDRHKIFATLTASCRSQQCKFRPDLQLSLVRRSVRDVSGYMNLKRGKSLETLHRLVREMHPTIHHRIRACLGNH